MAAVAAGVVSALSYMYFARAKASEKVATKKMRRAMAAVPSPQDVDDEDEDEETDDEVVSRRKSLNNVKGRKDDESDEDDDEDADEGGLENGVRRSWFAK